MPDEELVFDGRDFEALARELRVAADVYEREMTPTMFRIGTGVAEVAKQIARQHSKSIPATIQAVPLPGAVAVRAGGPDVPIAQLDELGNKGAKRAATTFRHPVFGNREVWVKQEKHPFLAPALLAHRRETTRRLEAAWERVLRMIEGK